MSHAATWIPTPDDIDKAGDALLEALIVVARTQRDIPTVGDLVVETSMRALDWERVGYLMRQSDDIAEIWTVGRRIVRWRNAGFWRVGPSGLRLKGFLHPDTVRKCRSCSQIEENALIEYCRRCDGTSWLKVTP